MGAVILVAAMAGVFFYERAQFQEYEVTWERVEVGSMNDDGMLDAGNSQTHSFTADEERLSTVTASVSWSDDTGDPDTFQVSLEGPNGTYTGTAEGSSSPLEVEVPIHEEPGTSTATGRSLQDAREQVNSSISWTNGTGEWTVTVELVEAPGQQVGGQDTGDDGSQGYEVTFAATQWVPTLSPR